MKTILLYLTLLKNSKGVLDLWVDDVNDPATSNFHNLYTTSARKGDIITWIALFGCTDFTGVIPKNPSLFASDPTPIPFPPGQQGFTATIGDKPGSYKLCVWGKEWDPKIRIISDCRKKTPRKKTSSALANN